MLNKILRFIEKLIPKKIYKFFQPTYHFFLSLFGAFIYRFPSRKIRVVGVTGTKGKSTVTELLNGVLEEAGFKTALQSTIHFKVGEKSWSNKYKMSMPGRFFIQKLLSDAVKEKCDWAILELTSEGARQFRNKFINLEALIFTNLSPEHIESHGSFEKYRDAKLSIANGLKKQNGHKTHLILNKDDEASELFMQKNADNKVQYSLNDATLLSYENKIEMQIGKMTIYSKLQGKFNAQNILAVVTFAREIGIPEEKIKAGIEKVESVPGRVQKVDVGQDFEVYVDYAHTKESLESLYQTFSSPKICVLGNTGGGRDTWKRPEMAKIADKYCSQIILTNEDPYDEDPQKILDEMRVGIKNKPVEIILDRREAIKSALTKAVSGDIVLITGKGTDPYIMEANNKKTPWSDFEITKEELNKLTK